MSAGTRQKVALTGFGSVGQSLARILIDEPSIPIDITLVADRGGFAIDAGGLNPRDLIAAKRSGSVATHATGQSGTIGTGVLSESRAEFLLELASTSYEDGEPGWRYVQDALNGGLDVVLASKGPLVAHWDELFRLASSQGRSVGYSATHGAPLPAIDLARFGLTGSRLRGIRALFNSTTGLLLEHMETGKSLEQAIAVVSAEGVAETNPRLDIEGWDAAAKCVIVGRSLFEGNLSLDQVERVGIEGLSTEDVTDARRAGTPIKLLCTIEPGRDGPRASVRPEHLRPNDPLSTLREGALGIVYDAEPVGPMFLAAYGKGGKPTAAAVIRDVLNISGLRMSSDPTQSPPVGPR